MSEPLPSALRGLVDQTVAAAGLSAAQREAIRAELEAHFLDGLSAGATPTDLADAFGDPAMAGALIGRAWRRSRAPHKRMLLVGATGVSIAYLVAALLVQTAPDSAVGARLADQAARVAEQVRDAESALEQRRFTDAFRLASGLRAKRNYWSETASVLILDQLREAADADDSMPWLRDSLVVLQLREGLTPRADILDATEPLLIEGVYGHGGRIGVRGRQLLMFSKGGTHLPIRALLLEPFYFARPVSRQRVKGMVAAISDARLARADAAASQLTRAVQ